MLIKFLYNCLIFTFILILILIVIFIMIMIMIIIGIVIVIVMIIITIHIIINGDNFVNTENSKTNESHRFTLDLTDKLNLKNP